MSTDVSTMTRISNRLCVGNKFPGRLLEHTDSMLAAQGNEFRAWHSCQFRSHAARDPPTFEHFERRHELDFPRCISRAFSKSRRQF
jgi:hypothetical protein